MTSFLKSLCFIQRYLSCRCEAEMEYLKIAQDLEMFAIGYFAIKVRQISIKDCAQSSLPAIFDITICW